MIFGNTSVPAKITINEPKTVYTNGDRINGSFIITSSGTISARYIKVRLSNYSNPYVFIRDEVSADYRCKPVKNLSLERNVFPIDNPNNVSSEQLPIRNIAEHVAVFNFEFEIPMSTETPTISVKCIKPSIIWCIEVEYCGKNTPSIIAQMPINVRPAMQLFPYDRFLMQSQSRSVVLDIPIPVASGGSRLKELFNKNPKETRHMNVFLQVSVPQHGLVSGQSPPNIKVDFSSADDSILVLKSFHLTLVLKCISTYGTRSGMDRSRHVLIRIENETPFKVANALVDEAIKKSRMIGHIPGSFVNRNIKFKHSLVTSLLIGCSKNPDYEEIVQLTMPVDVRFKESILDLNSVHSSNEAIPSYRQAMEDERLDSAPEYAEVAPGS